MAPAPATGSWFQRGSSGAERGSVSGRDVGRPRSVVWRGLSTADRVFPTRVRALSGCASGSGIDPAEGVGTSSGVEMSSNRPACGRGPSCRRRTSPPRPETGPFAAPGGGTSSGDVPREPSWGETGSATCSGRPLTTVSLPGTEPAEWSKSGPHVSAGRAAPSSPRPSRSGAGAPRACAPSTDPPSPASPPGRLPDPRPGPSDTPGLGRRSPRPRLARSPAG